MRYGQVIEACFLERTNRFIARVRIPGREEPETVHVKNTGRCRGRGICCFRMLHI